jgi:hypothetical protein
VENSEGLEADLDLGDQGLDADDEVEDDLEVGGDEHIDVKGQAVERRDAVDEVLQVDLENDEEVDEGQGLGVDVGDGEDGGLQPLADGRSGWLDRLTNAVKVGLDLGLDGDNGLDNGVDDDNDVGVVDVAAAADLAEVGRADVEPAGGGARRGDVRGAGADAGLVLARGAGRESIEDGGGHGGANREGGEGGAEELHGDGGRIRLSLGE